MMKQVTPMDLQNELSPFPGVKPKDFEFAMNYLLDGHVVMAAKRAGIAKSTAHQILKKPAVKKLLLAKGREVEQRCDITIDECLNELKKIAFAKPSDFMTNFEFDVEAGNIGMTLEDFKDIDTSAIESMNQKIGSGGIPYVEIKLYNKITALKELIGHLKGHVAPKELHIHLTKEQAKSKTAQEISADYQLLVDEAGS